LGFAEVEHEKDEDAAPSCTIGAGSARNETTSCGGWGSAAIAPAASRIKAERENAGEQHHELSGREGSLIYEAARRWRGHAAS
jgi:hypothetical protein